MLGLVILGVGVWFATKKLGAYVQYAETVKRVEALYAISVMANETETASSKQVSTEGLQTASAETVTEVTEVTDFVCP
jgi:hypothetical protein